MHRKAGYIVLTAVSFLLASATMQTEFPQTDISNGLIHARFYLPDAKEGYYRGTRFDWSGNIPELEYAGHSYCGQWFDSYRPTAHDAIMGPVESFAPLGYEQAGAGGRFIQIGVGVLSKMQELPYSPFNYYPILNTGSWTFKKRAASLEFIHTLRDSLCSYEYKKLEALVKGKPVLLLTHSLKNTGKTIIETEVYNHNLFLIDRQPTGPDFEIKFPFRLIAETVGQKGIGATGLATIKDSQIVFNRLFEKKEQVYSIIRGYGNNAKDYDIRIENHKTGAAIRITCDQPLSKLVFWGSSTIFSPEPYIKIRLDPGDVFRWKISYEFYTSAKKDEKAAQ
jgi:hypothetical protein